MLLFETFSGLSIYLLPFSISNQMMVLTHTLVGLVFILPFAWYQLRHWRIYRQMKMTHLKLTGYLAMVATLTAAVTGVVLTIQAVWQTRIGYTWDTVHIVATFALLVTVSAHITPIVVRDLKARSAAPMRAIIGAEAAFSGYASAIVLGLFVLTAVLVFAYHPAVLDNKLPKDYHYLYGPDRPFAPSLATTNTGQAFDSRTMSGSASCGKAGCHEEIYKEWETSAHRWSAMDVAFQKVQTVMADQNGPETTRYCGGCHDPISLFSGEKNLFNNQLTNRSGYQEGISCIVCHTIKKTDVKGNANYVVTQPERYLFALDTDTTMAPVTDFLIRAYPRKHVESLQHKLFKSPEFCAACHKQFIDEEINNVGWVQLQNQYDNWRKSRWNHPGNPTKTIECRECHMPLQNSFDPASGDDLDYNRTKDDGKHRSHRFLAANQFMPAALKLPRAHEQVDLTEKWLQGKIEIPEIADKWRTGPAVPIELVAPRVVAPGEDVHLDAVITNNKVGHDFPTGPLDIIQAWVEITVKDQDGHVLFTSGQRDDRHFIEPGAFMFKAEPVDQYGKLIDRHNLWEMVGVRYRRALFPGFADKASFSFACPASIVSVPTDTAKVSLDKSVKLRVPDEVTELHVKARLLYRKADQYLLNFLFGEDAGITATVTEISEDEIMIPVRERSPSTD